jgi:hypothetical protein
MDRALGLLIVVRIEFVGGGRLAIHHLVVDRMQGQ